MVGTVLKKSFFKKACTCNVQYVLNTCEDLKMISILNGPDLLLERGATMIEYLTKFMRVTPLKMMEASNFSSYIKPVIVRHE